jgi:diguanylate cyclase (GGDEF)-like protein
LGASSSPEISLGRKPYPGAPVTRHFQVHRSRASSATRLHVGERWLRLVSNKLDQLSASAQYVIAAALVLLVGVFDAVLDPNLSLSIFYAAPIAILAWHRSWRSARLAIYAATVVWLIADVVSGPAYNHEAYRFWNALVRFAFFFIVGYTVSRLRGAIEEEQRLARTDVLTGAANSRYFLEVAAAEVARQQRYQHPLSLAFLDCDNFKLVNDQHGHAAGDDLLRRIANAIQGCLREVDTVARLGGDEFAILLPESGAHAAEAVCAKVREQLMLAVAEYNVTFSVGLVTYMTAPATVEALVHSADEAMYESKKTGKNSSRHRVITRSLSEGTHDD